MQFMQLLKLERLECSRNQMRASHCHKQKRPIKVLIPNRDVFGKSSRPESRFS